MQSHLSSELNQIILYSKEEAIRLGNFNVIPEHLMLGILRDGNNQAYDTLLSHNINAEELKRKIELPIIRENPIPLEQYNSVTVTEETSNIFRIMVLEARQSKSKPTPMHLLLAILRDSYSNIKHLLERDYNFSYDSIKEEYKSTLSEGNFNKDNSSEGNPSKCSTNEANTQEVNTNSSITSETIVNCTTANNTADTISKESGETTTINSANNSANTNSNHKKSASTTPMLNSFGKDLTKSAQLNELDNIAGREAEIERVIQILGRRKKNNPILIGEPGVGKSTIIDGIAIRIAEKRVPSILLDTRIVSLDIASLVAGTKYRGQFEERIKFLINELSKNPNIILFIDEIHTIIGAGGTQGSLDAANMLKPALSRGEIKCIGATTLDEYRKTIEKDGALERRFQKVLVEPTDAKETLEILNTIKDKYEKHHNVKYTDEALQACIDLSTRYITDRFLPDKAIDLLDEAGSRARITTKERKAKESKPITIEKDHIAQIVSTSTNIPISKLIQKESSKLLEMGNKLKKRIIGQDKAVDIITKAIIRNRAGLRDPNRPIGTFLFLGPTGVGKTELAKVLAEHLFNSRDSIIRVDMSEYSEKYAASRIVGAPPGYVGYDEGGELAKKVKRNPYSVVLLDEIEKAHPDIYNLLLQILDEGRLTDSNGRYIDFRNCVIIMTSNIGTKELQNYGSGLGYSTTTKRDTEGIESSIVDKALKRVFAPEFLNRLDNQILFNSLSKEDIEKIIDIEIKKLLDRVELAGYKLRVTKEVKRFVADKGYNPLYGARPLKRAIQEHIEDPLAETIISNSINNGDIINLIMNNSKDGVAVKVKEMVNYI